MKKILLLPGDGIGPEVIEQAADILRALPSNLAATMEISTADIGGVAIDSCGEPLPPQTLAAAKSADAVLLGAVGAPQYDSLPADKKPEKGLLALRQSLGVFANLRPAVCYGHLARASSLRAELVTGLDILIVRELIGGIYFGEPRGIEHNKNSNVRQGINTMRYDENEIARIAHVAFQSARKRQRRLCSVDKANVLEVSMLWREVVSRIGKEYPDVELSHLYVDNAAMQLVSAPKQFDVIVTGNLFGDILSDIAAMLTGSIGMLPSAAINESAGGLYEPVHGSAPSIARQDKANPLAAILSAAMMLRYSLDCEDAALAIENATLAVLAQGFRTADIMDSTNNQLTEIGCAEMGKRVREMLLGS